MEPKQHAAIITTVIFMESICANATNSCEEWVRDELYKRARIMRMAYPDLNYGDSDARPDSD